MRVYATAGKPLAILVASQLTQEKHLEAIAHNFANAGTKGYQSVHARLESIPHTTFDNQSFFYPIFQGTTRDNTPGSIEQTGNPHHVALASEGYFAVQTLKGIRYTRNGEFFVDQKNRLVTQQGHLVLDNTKSPITLGKDKPSISKDGSIGEGKVRIGVFGIQNAHELLEEGENLLKTDSEVLVQQKPHMIQYALEDSNVIAVQESARMIELLRHFEQAQRMADENDQKEKRLINITPR